MLTHTHTNRETHTHVHASAQVAFCPQIYAKSMESRFALCASQIIKMPRESMQHFLVVERERDPSRFGRPLFLFHSHCA